MALIKTKSKGKSMYNPQLDTFIEVADSGSFSKAAERMYITPVSVLTQVNAL